MLELYHIRPYKSDGKTKYTIIEVVSIIADIVNSNSSVFSVNIIEGNPHSFTISSDNTNTFTIGGYGSGNAISDSGYIVAFDDEKEFIMIIVADIRNTHDSKAFLTTSGNSFNASNTSSNNSSASMWNLVGLICKDVFGNYVVPAITNTLILKMGLSSVFDIGIRTTEDFITTDVFVLRQGGVVNHLIPELFFCNKLGTTGLKIEKDGHQYTCISGPIFYQIC